MGTLYKHRATIAVPEQLIEKANHLALIMGESVADINTFTTANYEDAGGNKYAVCSTAVTDTFVNNAQSGELRPSPSFAEEANREWAAEAYATLGQPNGIIMSMNSDPQGAISEMGLVRIEVEEVQ